MRTGGSHCSCLQKQREEPLPPRLRAAGAPRCLTALVLALLRVAEQPQSFHSAGRTRCCREGPVRAKMAPGTTPGRTSALVELYACTSHLEKRCELTASRPAALLVLHHIWLSLLVPLLQLQAPGLQQKCRCFFPAGSAAYSQALNQLIK